MANVHFSSLKREDRNNTEPATQLPIPHSSTCTCIYVSLGLNESASLQVIVSQHHLRSLCATHWDWELMQLEVQPTQKIISRLGGGKGGREGREGEREGRERGKEFTCTIVQHTTSNSTHSRTTYNLHV